GLRRDEDLGDGSPAALVGRGTPALALRERQVGASRYLARARAALGDDQRCLAHAARRRALARKLRREARQQQRRLSRAHSSLSQPHGTGRLGSRPARSARAGALRRARAPHLRARGQRGRAMSEAAEAFPRGGVRWCALAIAGLSFWFWVGFPFANHNESYAWIAQLRTMDLHAALTRTLVGVANWRPLGTGTAWILYHAAHGSIAPVELLNYFVAAAAWAWVAWVVADRRVFGIAAFLVGGALFSGYIYLFHLHGIFYSPLLFFVAILLGARLGTGTK